METLCKELTDKSVEKVFIITDISKLYKLMGIKPLSPTAFDNLYDMSIEQLEMVFKTLSLEFYRMIYH